jgi:lysine-N-methylase
MKSFRIETPSFQNWSCQSCGECCRGYHLVRISPEEKQRIEAQGWKTADGVDPDALIVPEGGRFRLGHQASGACVFLDDAGRCRIHARFGEAAKPLACRLYPFAIHPAGDKLVVSLRFSCPSAAANHGKPVAAQLGELRGLAGELVPENFREIPPPPVLREERLDWPDFLRFVTRLDATLAPAGVPMTLKLLRTLHWLRAVEKAQFDQIAGPEADEILAALAQSADEKLPEVPRMMALPSRLGRFFFRTLVMQYARRDTLQDREAGLQVRGKRLGALLRFARASGRVPQLQPGFPDVEFGAIEKPFGPLPQEAEASLTRFFRVKVQGLHFCGRAYYDVPLVEGFRSLALLYPVVLWLARWFAAGAGSATLATAHVARAISVADHHHGYLPLLGTSGFRWRVRLLAQRADIERLCVWCSR